MVVGYFSCRWFYRFSVVDQIKVIMVLFWDNCFVVDRGHIVVVFG